MSTASVDKSAVDKAVVDKAVVDKAAVDKAVVDKVAAYQARLTSSDAERDRRIAEINEKYRSAFSCLPFRLHVIGVPCARVDVDVRRGDRRYPVELDWLLPLRRFAPMGCPQCGSTLRLVAGKSALGCRGCQPVRVSVASNV